MESWLPHPKTGRGTAWAAVRLGLQRPTSRVLRPMSGLCPSPTPAHPLKEELGGWDLEMDSLKAVSAGHLGVPIFPGGPGLSDTSAGPGAGPPVCAMPSWHWAPPQAGSPAPASLKCAPASLIGSSRTSVWSRQWHLAAGPPKAKPGFGGALGPGVREFHMHPQCLLSPKSLTVSGGFGRPWAGALSHVDSLSLILLRSTC